jgi:hypothetical protein
MASGLVAMSEIADEGSILACTALALLGAPKSQSCHSVSCFTARHHLFHPEGRLHATAGSHAECMSCQYSPLPFPSRHHARTPRAANPSS